MSLNKNIFIVSGESSGDFYGFELMEKLKAHNSNISFLGMGGGEMHSLASNLLSNSDISVTGLWEAVSKFKLYVDKIKKLKRIVEYHKIDLAILIDFPGCNFRLFKILSKHKIPILYYISPQLWAWRKNRVKKIRKYVDEMCVIFPFEVDFYKKHGVGARYVGHPLVEEVQSIELPQRRLGGIPKIGIFPGSRLNEVHRLMPTLVETICLLQKKGNFQFFLFKAPSIDREILSFYVNDMQGVEIVERKHISQYKDLDFALACSGTLTFELGLLKVPMIILYKTSMFTYVVVKTFFRKIKNIGMVNIILEKPYFPELIQNQMTPQNIVGATLGFLNNNSRYKEALSHLDNFRKKWRLTSLK
ncbi:MAG: lipid-A-disaccharide synthase [Deltaproteobacteria bacterium]|nr:lipid-A-disaccharide synthase [Deltaproteobacteria bacterium]